MSKIEGGCLCGSIRYTSDTDPVMVVNCYCENCRKNSGSTHSFNLGMPFGSVTVTGDTIATYVDTTGASGQPFNRHFCSNCGTHFRSEGPAYEGIEMIKGGTLDNPEPFAPVAHIWCEQKLSWVSVPEGAPTFPRNPQ
ncbi:GFA family protein [Paracoccus tegillarcae]|uniref:GFA family protein n=1 Tax=Paracoccus tegillarcae TaxID=1529068 RepID=A0A2K9F4Y0_9RHOB|nr:GFA family protein [Paracoccus tegillarcae]AUH34211.1 GFA family protein [Paracoccus tegillarcae]